MFYRGAGSLPTGAAWRRLKPFSSGQRFALLLSVCGAVGLYASFVLTVDKIRLAANPSLQLDCNLNPIISCGSVMKTPEASLLGFANSLIGLPAFAVLLFIGVTALCGVQYRRWVWLGLLAGSLAGVLLVHYLFALSVYHIGALCPYCMSVWVVTMLTFWYCLLDSFSRGYLPAVPARVKAFCQRHHADIFATWLLVIAGLIVSHFWYYLHSLL